MSTMVTSLEDECNLDLTNPENHSTLSSQFLPYNSKTLTIRRKNLKDVQLIYLSLNCLIRRILNATRKFSEFKA